MAKNEKTNSWQRTDGNSQATTITIDSNKYSGASVNNPTLTSTNVKMSDRVNYVCFAPNSVGTGQNGKLFLNVKGNLPVVSIASSTYQVPWGNSVTLNCTVSANPTHTSVRWEKIQDGVVTNIVPANNPLKYEGSTVSSPSLTIKMADRNSDQAFYKCAATNSIGTGKSSETFLNVTGACDLYQEGNCSSNCGNGDLQLKLICPSRVQYFISPCTRYTGCSDGWSAWEHFGTCSKTCNDGQQVFRRRCVTTIPGLVSTNCVGDNVKFLPCNIGGCPGSWSCWENDGHCSTSCGNGTQIRRRRCDNSNDGDECSGENIASVHCNIKECPVYKWGHLKELNLTKDDLKEMMKEELDELKSNLTIDSKNVSATISKRISARDDRPSAASVGYVGVALLLIPLVIIISFDARKFLAWVAHIYRKVCKRKSAKIANAKLENNKTNVAF